MGCGTPARRPNPAAAPRRCLQVRPDRPFRLALGSFIEDYNNRVEIIQREGGDAQMAGQTPGPL